jgi:two-component system, OmpR family, sensor kinase
MKKGFRSIRWQLLVWQTVLLAGVLAILLGLHYQLRKRDLIAAIDAELQETLLAVMPAITPPQQAIPPRKPMDRVRPGERDPKQIAGEQLAGIEQQGIYILCAEPGGLKRYGEVPASLTAQMPDPAGNLKQITRDGYRERIYPHHRMVIVIGKPLDEVHAEMSALLVTLLLIGGAVLLIGIAIGWLAVSRSLRPIRIISQTAQTIASGEHHRRIELAGAPDELASLAGILNESFDHLDEAIENQKRFTADASHELRTPVAVVIARTEAALKKNRSAEEYKGALEACLRAGQRMKSMAESLLELTRLDRCGTDLNKTGCDLNKIIAEAVDAGFLLSGKHPVEFEPPKASVMIYADCERIHQVITNLIANAVQHNPDGCAVRVTLEKKDGCAIIQVIDNGIGIPPGAQEKIFERFYRVDKSRSREHGGAGLGLSIARRIVEAHGGTLCAISEPVRGAAFIITLPG